MWEVVRHIALFPQLPMQGSEHLLCMQAKSNGHSEFIVHSGLQFGGLPMKLLEQAQTAFNPLRRQIELGPHGEGLQGSTCTIGSIGCLWQIVNGSPE